MAAWTLRLHGVGNASAVELGSPMATIERDGAPWLTIDGGGEGLCESIGDGERLRAGGWRVGMPGEMVALRAPLGMAPE